MRTRTRVMTFKNPFKLSQLPTMLPAGNYHVETDEELIEGLSFAAYQRVATLLHIPSPSGDATIWQTMNVDPQELEAAYANDINVAA